MPQLKNLRFILSPPPTTRLLVTPVERDLNFFRRLAIPVGHDFRTSVVIPRRRQDFPAQIPARGMTKGSWVGNRRENRSRTPVKVPAAFERTRRHQCTPLRRRAPRRRNPPPAI